MTSSPSGTITGSPEMTSSPSGTLLSSTTSDFHDPATQTSVPNSPSQTFVGGSVHMPLADKPSESVGFHAQAQAQAQAQINTQDASQESSDTNLGLWIGIPLGICAALALGLVLRKRSRPPTEVTVQRNRINSVRRAHTSHSTLRELVVEKTRNLSECDDIGYREAITRNPLYRKDFASIPSEAHEFKMTLPKEQVQLPVRRPQNPRIKKMMQPVLANNQSYSRMFEIYKG